MSANFETGFFVREPAWHGLGTVVQTAPTSADALRLAELDWAVEQKEVCVDGVVVPNYKANVRNKDKTVLGVVTDKYKIVQNDEAFSFTDGLLGEGVTYETAGSLKNGRTIWLLAKLPETRVLGDAIDQYLCFTNTHDGTGAVRVCCTPTRVVCQNTLNIALKNASRMWSTRHMGDLVTKLEEARHTLIMAQDYMTAFNQEAERLAASKIDKAEIDRLLDTLFNKDEADSDRKLRNVSEAKEAFYICYNAIDLVNFLGTKYGVLNAMADMVDHKEPARDSKSYRENNFGRILQGHALLDKTYELLNV